MIVMIALRVIRAAQAWHIVSFITFQIVTADITQFDVTRTGTYQRQKFLLGFLL